MREPFHVIKIDQSYEKYIGQNDILFLRASRIDSCYLSYYNDLTDPKIISDELNEIFDIGNDKHDEEKILNEGAKRNIALEKRISIIHESGKFIITGQPDALEFDFKGRFIRDYKTTKFEGFHYFIKDGMVNYVPQLSIYAYLVYVRDGVYYTKGVITKIDKMNPRNRFSLEGDLFPIEKVRTIILTHPVLLLWFEKITKEKLIKLAIKQMWGRGWMCGNCPYAEGCEVKKHI